MAESSRPSDIFPERLRAARDLRELSQGQLADRAGLQSSWISHFETGGRKPSFENLRRLADALRVTTDYLLGRVDTPAESAGADKLHRHIVQMTARDREIAEDFLKVLSERAKSRSRKDTG